MRHLIHSAVVSLALLSDIAGADTAPTLLPAPVTKVFAPVGFDSNDDAEIVIHGHFPSWCYKLGPVTADVDMANRRIVVHPTSWFYRDGVCHEMQVPYVTSVKLGPLMPGEYTVEVTGMDGQKAKLPIVATSDVNPDAYIYAPVDTVEWTKDRLGRQVIRLSGTPPEVEDGCLVLVEPRLIHTDDTFVVLPITTIDSDPGVCGDLDLDRFTYDVVVPESVRPGEYLLHVRALAGQSLNRLVNVR